jgi:hypothetical protein
MYFNHLKQRPDYAHYTLQQLVRDVKNCMILNNFYWAVWSLVTLKQQDYKNPKAFNFEYCRLHGEM